MTSPASCPSSALSGCPNGPFSGQPDVEGTIPALAWLSQMSRTESQPDKALLGGPSETRSASCQAGLREWVIHRYLALGVVLPQAVDNLLECLEASI